MNNGQKRTEKEYILGTHDEEISRLGLQHNVWRPRALDAWRRAGFTVGQTILDVGCGPGYAAVDLAEIVGPTGQVVAMDKSRRFLDVLEGRSRQRELSNIRTIEIDLDQADFPALAVQGAWARWVFAFVKRPHDLLERVVGALQPGGILVLHEYFDYATWRLVPRSAAFEEFVGTVMRSWRDSGGEPDIGLQLPLWLRELGCEIKTMGPIIDIVPASNYVWQWPTAFVEVNLKRLMDLGYLVQDRANAIAEAVQTAETNPSSLMITPAVLEIVACKALPGRA